MDNSGIVDFNDFSMFAGAWQIEMILIAEDLDRNGKVDLFDLEEFRDNWQWAE